MSKLTIHHLARRLPYGLIFQEIGESGEYSRLEFTPDMLSKDRNIVIGRNYLNKYYHYVESGTFKPYLRPLSQLTEEIEHGGDTFEPFIKLTSSGFWCRNYTEWWDLQEPDYERMMDNIPREILLLLLEWHFVIDEPQGTYIPVTKDNNPYK